MLGLVGIDSQTGQPRFAFGVPELLDGIDVVVLAVGLFAVGETLYVAAYTSRLPETLEKMSGSIWMSAQDWKRSVPAWLRATAIGFPFGSIPAGGAEIPTFLSYSLEKPGRKPRTTLRPPASWCRCSRSAFRPRPLPRSC
jgi:putative tricarboxylic transport membrane protein